MLVEKLKPHVTAFSSELPIRFRHKDVVVVGGKIKRIYNLGKNFYKDLVDQVGLYMDIEDGIGEVTLFVVKEVYEKYREYYNYGFEIGDLLLAEGYLYFIDTGHPIKNEKGEIIDYVNNHDEEEKNLFNVFAYEIRPFPEQIQTEEVKA